MNRRSVLRWTATTALGMALPRSHAFARDAGPGPEMSTLSAYMSAAGPRALPADAAEHAKHHIIDTLGAMISGSELLPGQAAQRYIKAHGTQGTATIAGATLTAGPRDAALVNGVMAHADETDDSHDLSRSHPGASIVPATLAMGEEFGIDGAHFLRAVALGYDVGTRVVMAMGGAGFSYESTLSTHSIAGTFGSTAAAACAAGLDAQQMRWVIDYAAQQSAGIVVWHRDIDHIEKAFVFAGRPASDGVTAALAVQSGWTGVDDVFSGPDNFFLAYAPKANTGRLVEELGQRFEISRTDIKKWTVGSPIQAPLDAMAAIRSKRPFEADQVRRVTIRLAPSVAAVVDSREMPDICLQHMAAVMLLDKTASFRAAHDKPRMQDAAVLRERAKVDLVRDKELDKFLPARVTIVDIEFTDGSHGSERIDAVRGTTRNPMSRAEVIDKVRDLTAPILGQEKTEHLIETVYGIETLADVRKLRPLLQRS